MPHYSQASAFTTEHGTCVPGPVKTINGSLYSVLRSAVMYKAKRRGLITVMDSIFALPSNRPGSGKFLKWNPESRQKVQKFPGFVRVPGTRSQKRTRPGTLSSWPEPVQNGQSEI